MVQIVKGVIFDMDGVLFDTERACLEIEKEMAAEGGYELPDELVAQIFGSTQERIEKLFLETFGPDFNYDLFVETCYGRLMNQIHTEGLPIKKGAVELLEYLSENGYPIALASSSEMDIIETLLNLADMRKFFTVIVGGDMLEKSKPAPDIFLAAARALGLPPENCIAIEDSQAGTESACSAGCITVMVPDMLPPTDRQKQICATILEDLTQVPAFIEQLNTK